MCVLATSEFRGRPDVASNHAQRSRKQELFTKPAAVNSRTSKRSNPLNDITLPIMHPVCRALLPARFRSGDIPCKRSISGMDVNLERVVIQCPPAAALVLVRQGLPHAMNLCPQDVNDPRFFVRIAPLGAQRLQVTLEPHSSVGLHARRRRPGCLDWPGVVQQAVNRRLRV